MNLMTVLNFLEIEKDYNNEIEKAKRQEIRKYRSGI